MEVGMIIPGHNEHAPHVPHTPQLAVTTILGSNMVPPLGTDFSPGPSGAGPFRIKSSKHHANFFTNPETPF